MNELDKKYAAKIRKECHSGDTELDHSDADQLLISLLNELGYTETVKAWGEVDKWYA